MSHNDEYRSTCQSIWFEGNYSPTKEELIGYIRHQYRIHGHPHVGIIGYTYRADGDDVLVEFEDAGEASCAKAFLNKKDNLVLEREGQRHPCVLRVYWGNDIESIWNKFIGHWLRRTESQEEPITVDSMKKELAELKEELTDKGAQNERLKKELTKERKSHQADKDTIQSYVAERRTFLKTIRELQTDNDEKDEKIMELENTVRCLETDALQAAED